jgi:hypothetical protein
MLFSPIEERVRFAALDFRDGRNARLAQHWWPSASGFSSGAGELSPRSPIFEVFLHLRRTYHAISQRLCPHFFWRRRVLVQEKCLIGLSSDTSRECLRHKVLTAAVLGTR